MRPAFIAVTLLGIGSSVSIAREIYVNNISGDDKLCGDAAVATTNTNGPVRTINKALRLALAGDRVVLANTGQPYRESISLQGERHSSVRQRAFVLQGNGAILDGSAPVPDDLWEHVQGDVFRFQPPLKAHQQLLLNGQSLAQNFQASEQGPMQLKPLDWCLYDGWIYYRTEAGMIPQQYSPSYAALQTGITLYQSHDVVVYDLIVQGFQLDGIQANECLGGRLISVTSRANGRSGVCVAGGSRMEISDCLFESNGVCELLLEDYPVVRVFDCRLSPQVPGNIERRDAGRLYLDSQLLSARVPREISRK
jgi:hypothetical protein